VRFNFLIEFLAYPAYLLFVFAGGAVQLLNQYIDTAAQLPTTGCETSLTQPNESQPEVRNLVGEQSVPVAEVVDEIRKILTGQCSWTWAYESRKCCWSSKADKATRRACYPRRI